MKRNVIYLVMMDRNQYDENDELRYNQTLVLRAFTTSEAAWEYAKKYELDVGDDDIFKVKLVSDHLNNITREVEYQFTPIDETVAKFSEIFTFAVQPVMLEE